MKNTRTKVGIISKPYTILGQKKIYFNIYLVNRVGINCKIMWSFVVWTNLKPYERLKVGEAPGKGSGAPLRAKKSRISPLYIL